MATLLRNIAVLVCAAGCGGGRARPPEAPLLPGAGAVAQRSPMGAGSESLREVQSLTVTLPEEARTELAAALEQRSVIAVAFQGDRMALVPGCSVNQPYEYIQDWGARESLRIFDENELEDLAPLGAERFSTEIREGNEIVVELATAGVLRYSTSDWRGVPENVLTGDCKKATHVLADIRFGAFQVGIRRGSATTPRVVLESGRLDACRVYGPGDFDPGPNGEGKRAYERESALAAKGPKPECNDVIAIWARPIVPPEPKRGSDSMPFEYPEGQGPQCNPASALRIDTNGKPYCLPSQSPHASPRRESRARFQIGAKTILDKQTGLEWQRRSSKVAFSDWMKARDYCHQLELDGGGWMLPLQTQLETLLRPDLHPATDLGVFPDVTETPVRDFWVANRIEVHSRGQTLIDFETGGMSVAGGTARVRCVRRRR